MASGIDNPLFPIEIGIFGEDVDAEMASCVPFWGWLLPEFQRSLLWCLVGFVHGGHPNMAIFGVQIMVTHCGVTILRQPWSNFILLLLKTLCGCFLLSFID